MKGLFISNLYKTVGNTKILAIAIVVGGIILLATGSYTFVQIFVCLSIITLSINSLTCVLKDAETRWDRYEITMPVSRQEIIKSKYLFSLCEIIIGVVTAGFFVGLAVFIHGNVFFVYGVRDILSLLSLGIGISLLVGAVFYPLIYTFDREKGESFIVVSIITSVGITYLLLQIINNIFPQNESQYYFALLVYLLIIILLFISSYFMTIKIFAKKDI